MDRATISMGPGLVTWDGATIHVEDEIKMKIAPKLFDVVTAGYGVVDRRREDMEIEVSFTPKMWDNLDKLFPYATTAIGSSIYGATDKALVIKPVTGTGWTIANAAITKLPDIKLSASKAMLGEMTLTGLLANNAATGTMSSYVSTASGGALSGFDLTKILNGLYTAAWGSTIASFHSEDGFDISFDLSLEDVMVDGLGTIDKMLSGLAATCKVTPVGPAASIVISMHGDKAIGEGAPINDLVITGGRSGLPTVTLKSCTAQMSSGRTGSKAKRIGEMEFKTVRLASGAALWTIA